MIVYDRAVAECRKNPSKHAESLKLPGFYRCCIYKWKKQREKDHWSLLCKACPKMAKTNKECPDYVREFAGEAKKFSSRAASGFPEATSILPPELVSAIGEQVASWLHLMPCDLPRRVRWSAYPWAKRSITDMCRLSWRKRSKCGTSALTVPGRSSVIQ